MFEWLVGEASKFSTNDASSVAGTLGSIWDWGTENKEVVSGIMGAGKEALAYMNKPEDASLKQVENREAQIKAHNAGIGAAAKRYRNGTA